MLEDRNECAIRSRVRLKYYWSALRIAIYMSVGCVITELNPVLRFVEKPVYIEGM